MKAETRHEFTLILAGLSDYTDDAADALYEAGCDDALVGSRDGVVFLDFGRRAPSFRDAVLSAIRNVRWAGYEVARVEPDDLVTLAEVGRRLGRTRESVRLLALGLKDPRGFPPPVAAVKGVSSLWRWAEVAAWAEGAGVGSEAGAAERAATMAALNDALDLIRQAGGGRAAVALLRELNGSPAKPAAPRGEG